MLCVYAICCNDVDAGSSALARRRCSESARASGAGGRGIATGMTKEAGVHQRCESGENGKSDHMYELSSMKCHLHDIVCQLCFNRTPQYAVTPKVTTHRPSVTAHSHSTASTVPAHGPSTQHTTPTHYPQLALPTHNLAHSTQIHTSTHIHSHTPTCRGAGVEIERDAPPAQCLHNEGGWQAGRRMIRETEGRREEHKEEGRGGGSMM